MRLILKISYKGTPFLGWQVQGEDITVQGCLEKALETILRKPVLTLGSGRTDAGVHAKEQWVQVDVDLPSMPYSSEIFIYKINRILSFQIAVEQAWIGSESFHVRHDALSRTYIYTLYSKKDAFAQDLYCPFKTESLNIALMQTASDLLLQHHDFQAFCKTKTGVYHFQCTIHKAYWYWETERLFFTIEANRFLRGMVRTLVGTLLDVGVGKTSLEEFKEILESKDRKKAGRSVPAEGLFLSKVTYPEELILGLVDF